MCCIIALVFFREGNLITMTALRNKLNYSHTRAACCLAYVTQSVAAMFMPLLFVRFGSEFGLSMDRLTALVTVTFFTQIFVDAAAPLIVQKTGYRALAVIAAAFSFCGIAGLSFMADLVPGAFWGLFICTELYAIGSGLIEVLITPIVDSCPTDKKAGSMAFVHSAYCAGCALVVLLSHGVFFRFRNRKLALSGAFILRRSAACRRFFLRCADRYAGGSARARQC